MSSKAALSIVIATSLFIWIGFPKETVRRHISEAFVCYLKKRLIAGSLYRSAQVTGNKDQRLGVPVYILGGTQASLILKFKTAARLYEAGEAQKIWVLHTFGITAYDNMLKRNLTNDEWAIKNLTGLGVQRDDIDFVHIQEGLFGTEAEAEAVREELNSIGLDRIILVCSSYHARRVNLSFSALIQKSGVKMELFTTDEPICLSGLVSEYMKLMVYENLIIPLKVRFDH